MKRLLPRFTIAETLKSLGILIVVYFVLGALMTWAIEPLYPTVYRWSAFVATVVFLILGWQGLSELLHAAWWRSGSRDRRQKKSRSRDPAAENGGAVAEAEHARAVARRVLTLRILGVVLLLTVFAVEGDHNARKYVWLCVGCALVQLAHLDFPKPAKDVGASRISFMELMHPGMYWGLSFCTVALALASFGLELWAGFYFFHWKTVLFTLLVTTAATDFLATRILWVVNGGAGILLTLVAGIILFTGG